MFTPYLHQQVLPRADVSLLELHGEAALDDALGGGQLRHSANVGRTVIRVLASPDHIHQLSDGPRDPVDKG
jgi:hypothetical protein